MDAGEASNSSGAAEVTTTAGGAGAASAAGAVSDEKAVEAERLKNEGNVAFESGKYRLAESLYSQAIEANPSIASYYTNRAFASIRMEAYGAALADANKAIDLDPKFIKAYYRRATAKLGLFRYKEALADYRLVVKLVPNAKDAQQKLKECEKQVKRIAFELAIQGDHPSDVLFITTLDYKKIPVEDSYSGPRIDETAGVNKEFVLALMQHLKAEKRLHRRYVVRLILEAYNIFKPQPSVVDIPIPEGGHFTVCGDIHGQFYDLCNIFENLNGLPSEENPYLFNGDFVDRGSFSVEVIILLLAFKVLLPAHFFMSRGNHETTNMNTIYGFEGEVKAKYDDQLMRAFTDLFQALPLGHCIQKKVFCVHGGLFEKENVTLQGLREINRFREPPSEGPMSDMLWADPQASKGRGPSKRGTSIAFGPDITEAFLQTNDLKLVIRSHEVRDEGYEIEHGGRLITVFSAPNYCDTIGNKGAYIKIKSDCTYTCHSFKEVPHPTSRPMQYASAFSLLGLGPT